MQLLQKNAEGAYELTDKYEDRMHQIFGAVAPKVRVLTDLTSPKRRPRVPQVVPAANLEDRRVHPPEEFKGQGLDIPVDDFAIVENMLNFNYRKTGAYGMSQDVEHYLTGEMPKHSGPVQEYMREYITTLQAFRKAYYPVPSSNRGVFRDPAHRGVDSNMMESWGLEEPVGKIRPQLTAE